jgi:hypothetical protein
MVFCEAHMQAEFLLFCKPLAAEVVYDGITALSVLDDVDKKSVM